MFTRITNFKGSTYFEYDYGNIPSRYIEVRSIPRAINDVRWDLTLGNDKIYRQTVKNWAECVELEHYFSKKDVLSIRRRGVLPEGYSLHHIHPRALGGNTMELKNMVLIPYDLHERLHDFLRDFIIIKCLPRTHLTAPIPQNKKVFMQVPVLPPVVREIDLQFAMKPACFERDIWRAEKIITGYLRRYPNSICRPLFVNGVIAQSPNRTVIPSWPPARVEPTKVHQLHRTHQKSPRFQQEHWSFNEWAASVRNRSQNFRT